MNHLQLSAILGSVMQLSWAPIFRKLLALVSPLPGTFFFRIECAFGFFTEKKYESFFRVNSP